MTHLPTNLPTLHDVAKACGVSVATASKALSPHADRNDVGRATVERVRAAAAQVGYDRARMANIRARRKWGNVGLLWGRRAPRSEGVYETLFATMADALTERGFHLLFTPVQSLADWRSMQIAQRLDGVLVAETAPHDVLEELHRRDYPTVLINCRSDVPLQQVLPDDHAGAVQVTEHLIRRGCRRLIYVPHYTRSGHVSEAARWQGVNDAADRHGIEVIEGPARDPDGLARLCQTPRSRTSRTSRQPPVGIVMYDYLRVPVLLQALQRADITVPGDALLTCCSDVSWFAHLHPPITAWQVPMADMVHTAVERLCAQLDDRALDGHAVVLPGSLAIRDSSTVPARRRR
jgi:LacI family transcriptional regulator